MAGRKGRSGGRNRKSGALHVLQGTFRGDRHGLPPTEGTAALQSAPEPEMPAGLVAGLKDAGRSYVTDTFMAIEGWTPSTLLLLRKAGELTDALARSKPTGRGARLWLAKHRALIQTLRALGL